MTLALVLIYASLFIIKKPNGTPIKTLDKLKPDFNFSGLRGIRWISFLMMTIALQVFPTAIQPVLPAWKLKSPRKKFIAGRMSSETGITLIHHQQACRQKPWICRQQQG